MRPLPLIAALAAVAAGSLLATQSAQAALCALTDVSLTINGTTYNPSTCADGVAQGGGPTTETASLNTQLGTSDFVYLDKSDDAGNPTGLGGITFQVGAVSGNSGNWTVTWTDVAGLPNLPLVVDLGVGLFAGNNASGYLFEDVLLPITPNTGTGTFDINFVNNGGQQPNISHLLLAGSDPRSVVVPEPGSLALLGSGFLGMGGLLWWRRRRDGDNGNALAS
jgi:PEP-CTERM motif